MFLVFRIDKDMDPKSRSDTPEESNNNSVNGHSVQNYSETNRAPLQSLVLSVPVLPVTNGSSGQSAPLRRPNKSPYVNLAPILNQRDSRIEYYDQQNKYSCWVLELEPWNFNTFNKIRGLLARNIRSIMINMTTKRSQLLLGEESRQMLRDEIECQSTLNSIIAYWYNSVVKIRPGEIYDPGYAWFLDEDIDVNNCTREIYAIKEMDWGFELIVRGGEKDVELCIYVPTSHPEMTTIKGNVKRNSDGDDFEFDSLVYHLWLYLAVDCCLKIVMNQPQGQGQGQEYPSIYGIRKLVVPINATLQYRWLYKFYRDIGNEVQNPDHCYLNPLQLFCSIYVPLYEHHSLNISKLGTYTQIKSSDQVFEWINKYFQLLDAESCYKIHWENKIVE